MKWTLWSSKSGQKMLITGEVLATEKLRTHSDMGTKVSGRGSYKYTCVQVYACMGGSQISPKSC